MRDSATSTSATGRNQRAQPELQADPEEWRQPEPEPEPEPEPQPQPEPQPLRQDDAGGEEEATRFQDFVSERCVSHAASAPWLREAR